MTALRSAVATPDPFRTWPSGRYDDGVVAVIASPGTPGLRAGLTPAGRLVVRHHLGRIDDDLAEILACALAPLTEDPDVFIRAFTGVVLTSDPDPMTAWERFYRASLARFDDSARTGYVEVHRHATALLPRTSVVDIGASLGLLALHLARRGAEVIAVEPEPGTADLLRIMAARLGMAVDVRATDGRRLPLTAGSVDGVALIHVLEHVDEATGVALVREAQRVARERVVVAVPYESAPNALYGHVRTMTPASLSRLAATSGWRPDVHEHHGGWLVLDHP